MAFLARLFLYLVSILWIILGVLLVFATDLVREKLFNKFFKKIDIKKMSVIPIIIGVLLFLSAFANTNRLFVIIIGLLAVIKGIVGIVATEKMQKMMDWWLNANNNILRIWGVVIIILGTIVLMGI